ncbi:hypothetical protein T484DRAFT_3636871 [Baffinella frigidus]|nr:hypothetical protein T484DRAFT_3636871 [Cryptophyta sp. CCMP2293]
MAGNGNGAGAMEALAAQQRPAAPPTPGAVQPAIARNGNGEGATGASEVQLAVGGEFQTLLVQWGLASSAAAFAEMGVKRVSDLEWLLDSDVEEQQITTVAKRKAQALLEFWREQNAANGSVWVLQGFRPDDEGVAAREDTATRGEADVRSRMASNGNGAGATGELQELLAQWRLASSENAAVFAELGVERVSDLHWILYTDFERKRRRALCPSHLLNKARAMLDWWRAENGEEPTPKKAKLEMASGEEVSEKAAATSRQGSGEGGSAGGAKGGEGKSAAPAEVEKADASTASGEVAAATFPGEGFSTQEGWESLPPVAPAPVAGRSFPGEGFSWAPSAQPKADLKAEGATQDRGQVVAKPGLLGHAPPGLLGVPPFIRQSPH